ncbi:MAG: YidC/Oxa1 family rane protein insertase [Acidimicrobiaceae bacterium]|jgi:YidC/Oxa1 family membrane protein insertase
MFVAVSLFEPFAKLLAFFYSIWPSYGGAIALFTLTIMVVLTPLTLKGTRSMMVLQALQPEMKKIQAQHKDDRQKLNEELLKFYKENKINPLGGCLPLLVQLPVFIILYNVLKGLTAHSEIVDGKEVFLPQYLDPSSKMWQALHSSHEMKSWGMDLSKSVTTVMSDSGFGKALPYILMIVFVALTSLIQQKQISGRNPAAASNPQQQMLMKLGPIMLTGISIIYQGGLVIYLLVSNLYRVAQQALISRTIYNTPEAKQLLAQQMKDAEEKKKSGAPQGGFFKQLLGDAAPQLNKDKAGSNGGKGPPKPAAGGTKPPAAKSNGGRTTPPKNRSAAARKKKKRK